VATITLDFFPLATRRLACEREQGITIDVAAIIPIPRRPNFIVADTPGHVELHPNMVTGSFLLPQVCHYLIDARKGSNRADFIGIFIANLLRISHRSRRDQQDGFGELWRRYLI